ncbi:MAG: DUF882 domain-containing protein [Anderseniella sp.]
MFFSGCLAATVACGVFAGTSGSAHAETRTLSMYFTHTKESLTVTYKRNGNYDPAALNKINWFLRDWRRGEQTKMSLETVDLLWELHADLGSRKPVHIVSAYRSPRTNAMLKRIGRKVAKTSQHMQGRAIDFYFPDVPVEKIMGSAFLRKVGGVGYYPRSGKYGFVHIDSGNVRHWPRMSATRQASMAIKYSKTVLARRGGVGNTLLAAASTSNNFSAPATKQQSGPISLVPNSMAEAVVAAVANTPAPTAATLATLAPSRELAPKPRPKPIEVLMLAAANMQISPASASATNQNFNVANDASVVRGKTGPVTLASLAYEDQNAVSTNSTAKGSLNTDGSGVVETMALRPLSISYANTSSLNDLFTNTDAIARRDGAPQPFVNDEDNAVRPLSGEDKSALARLIEAFMPGTEQPAAEEAPTNGINRSGKGDSQLVNRSGKGDFTREIVGSQGIWKQSSAQDIEVLRVVEIPLTFKN